MPDHDSLVGWAGSRGIIARRFVPGGMVQFKFILRDTPGTPDRLCETCVDPRANPARVGILRTPALPFRCSTHQLPHFSLVTKHGSSSIGPPRTYLAPAKSSDLKSRRARVSELKARGTRVLSTLIRLHAKGALLDVAHGFGGSDRNATDPRQPPSHVRTASPRNATRPKTSWTSRSESASLDQIRKSCLTSRPSG